MKITYVLPRPEFGGGNKVILEHAELLAGLGHELTVLADGPRPGWVRFAGEYIDLRRHDPIVDQDLVIATFWTTIQVALDLQVGPVAHFCQGYEGDLEHLAHERQAIERAYAEPLPTLAISEPIARLVRREFARSSRIVPPPLDPRFRPRPRRGPRRRRPIVVVTGIFEAPVKGVDRGLATVAALYAKEVPCRLHRISMLPLTQAERDLLEPDRFLHAVDPDRVATELRNADLLIFTSRTAEGFGLPLLEALASGLPAVGMRTPSTHFVADSALPLVTDGDVDGLAAAAADLLRVPRLWRSGRRRGLERSRQFRTSRVSAMLDAAVHWAASQGVAG